jgi:2-dehydro-3-deoxyphosphogluconate aldolase/(4S)-4-hydroxy-2-oxoglutarate aldolase
MKENMQHGIEHVLAKHHVIPVVTVNSMEETDAIMNRLLEQNIHVAEITLRTDYALTAIAHVKKNYPTIDVGVGTVISIGQVAPLVDLGVDFIVSPGATMDLIHHLQNGNIPFIPGAVTPSEIMEGLQMGLDTFKFFPANLFGGIDALKAYGQVFPAARFCPTGGINGTTYSDYLALSNVISVGGSWMLK